MSVKPPDRRSQRTEQLLRQALIALILEKGYNAITVQDIIDRANVGRTTFYAHFYDKEDLMLSGFEQLRGLFETQHKKLLAEGYAVPEGAGFALLFFQHTQGHHQLYKALVGKHGSEQVVKKIFHYFTDLLREHLETLHKEKKLGDVPLEVAVQALSGSLLHLLTWWLDNDMPYSPEQMTAWFYRLALQPMLTAG